MIKEGYTSETFTLPVRHNERIKQDVSVEYANKKTLITAALIPVVASVPLIYKSLKDSFTTTTIPVTSTVMAPTPLITPPPVLSPEAVTSMATTIQQTPPEILAQPTGLIADKSLEMLANVLDPLVQLMVAISFPIASVIMIGGMFFFMIGNTEKAWSTIFNASLGYVLIQLSPLFLQILRQVGETV